MSRNPMYCPHNITDFEDDGEEYCTSCGVVLEEDKAIKADYLASMDEDRFQQDGQD